MKIVFITCSRLGDAVLTTNVLNRLVKTYPKAKFTILTNKLAGSVFEHVPRLEKLIKIEKKSFKRHWIEAWSKLAFTRWDMIVDMRDTFVSRLLMSKKTYIKKKRSDIHKIQENALAIGIKEPLVPKIWIPDKVYENVSDLVPMAHPYICIAPTANWLGKQWPADCFVELIAKMMDGETGFLPKMPIIVLGAKHEKSRMRELFSLLKEFEVLDRIGVFEPIESAACISKAKFFIGNDSGLMHISWTVGTKTFALFGPGFPEIYGPLGAHSHIIQTDIPSIELQKQIPKANEFKQSLMTSLPVDKVFEVIKNSL